MVKISPRFKSEVESSAAFKAHLEEKQITSSELGLISYDLIESKNGRTAGETLYHLTYMYLGNHHDPFVVRFSLNVGWEIDEPQKTFLVEKLIEADSEQISDLNENGVRSHQDDDLSATIEAAILEVEGSIDVSLEMIERNDRLTELHAFQFGQDISPLPAKEVKAMLKVVSILASGNHKEIFNTPGQFKQFLESTNRMTQEDRKTLLSLANRMDEVIFLGLVNFGTSLSRQSRIVGNEIKIMSNTAENLRQIEKFIEMRTAVSRYPSTLESLKSLLVAVDEHNSKLLALNEVVERHRDHYLLQAMQGDFESFRAFGRNEELPLQFAQESLGEVQRLFERVSESSCKNRLK